MKQLLTRFWKEEDGFGTVELVILIGVLVAIALLFRNQITEFVKDLMDDVFDDNVKDPDYQISPSPTTT